MKKTKADYLAMGFDEKMADYFARGRRTIVSVKPNPDFTLTLRFDNGELRRYDAACLLHPGTAFAPISTWENFRRVYLDENHCVAWDIDPKVDSTIVWSNKLDLCPDGCYVDSVPVSEAK